MHYNIVISGNVNIHRFAINIHEIRCFNVIFHVQINIHLDDKCK